MLSYENYENNLKVHDKYGLSKIRSTNSVTYKGNLGLLDRKKKDKNVSAIPPLAAAIVGIKNTAAPLPSNLDFVNLWTDFDAQEAYLSTKPTCYLILGKPGLGSYTLGENLSKKLNCIHLSSRNVILDEIEHNSATGRCLDFNMRHNKVCKFDHILAIIKVKIQSSVIKHRGYVISGVPLVTSSKTDKYFTDSLYAEESLAIMDDLLYDLIWNLKRKKGNSKIQRTASHSTASSEDNKAEEEEVIEEEQKTEFEPEETEEQIVEIPKYLLDLCCGIITNCSISVTSKKTIFFQQIKEIFNFNPDIIIYISSPDTDTLTKKSRKYFNYMNNSNTFKYFPSNIALEIRWPNKYTMTDFNKPYDMHVFNPKYNCKQPINFLNRAVNQICNFKMDINPFVDKKLQDFDTKYILNVDGRTSVHQMLHYIMGKILLIPVKPVLIPKPLYLEEPPEDLDEFWGMVKQLNTIKSGVLNFHRYPSSWYTRCPVELQKRRSIQGKPKFAVSLFKHVYLLSSLDAMISFCKNPRPYLMIENLEPTCRIIVLGTKSSGKTMIAKCLSWLFDTPIICYKTFLNNEKQKKYDSFAKSILSEIIATIEDARFMKWQNVETQRTSNLNTWFNSVLHNLNNYVFLLNKHLKINNEEELTDGEIDIPESELKQIEVLKRKLSFLPILDDLDLCNETILDRNLLKYAPLELITETTKPELPVLGDKDVSEAISAYILANDLQKDIEPSTEELMNEMAQILLKADEESMSSKQKYGKFIIDDFPSDPEYWGYLEEFKLLPDYTVVITENKEMDTDLLKKYFVIDQSPKIYQERYLLSTDPLIKLKLLQKKPIENLILDVKIVVHELLENVYNLIFGTHESASNNMELLTSFNEVIDKFREEWDSVKLKLEESSKAIVLVEIDNKSDIEIIDEILLKLRQSYYLPCTPLEDNELEDKDDEYNGSQDMVNYNEPYYLGETNIYCPVAYYDYGVLWEAKSEFCIQFDNKAYYFSKEECMNLFQNDVMKYLTLNEPFKPLPALKICVIGSIGSGKTTLSKQLAKELGLIHVDFEEFVNSYLIPKHFKKVGRQYENNFKDIPIDAEAVMEFQGGEEEIDGISDIIFNENELRRMIYNYFEKGAPILSSLIQKLLKLLWTTEPYSRTGFVLDGFPKLPIDAEDMIASFCVPDIVIDLQGSSEKTLERLSSKMLKKWKMQLNEAKIEAKNKFQQERNKWFDLITKEIVTKLIVDEIINNVFPDISKINITPEMNMSIQSTIIDAHPSGSANVDANLFNYYHELILTNPEPVDQTQWEKAEDVLETINTRLESIFEVDDENIQALKEILSDNKIKNLSVDGTKSMSKVFRNVFPKLSFLRKRNESYFEQTFIISCDIAETLLMEGFCLVSKFNRMCPVYIFENPHVISNPYMTCKRMNRIFPVVHRTYIYFLCSVNNLVKFRRNPLKYIQNNSINLYWEFPLRIGIIGPPKCGKSELASKLAKRYGLLYMSKGQVIRHVLKEMNWTEVAVKMNTKLQLGECIDTELIMNAVRTVSIDKRVVTNGFVLDGFPDKPTEATELQKIGLYPLIIIEIDSNVEKILSNSQNELYYALLKEKPPYSRPFIEYRNIKWQESCDGIKKWINDDVQNLYTVCGTSSKWQCLHDATNFIEDIIHKINYYLCNVRTKAVPAFVMCFSNEIFEQRMSSFKNFCPICLRKNIIRHNSFPVDKRGLVQYKNVLCWFCSDHMSLGLLYPDTYLQGIVNIPEIAVPVKNISQTLIYEDGICIVTYADNLPSQKIVRGTRDFAASYRGSHYLFCSSKCLQKFLATPNLYYDITVFKEATIFPKLSLKKLPNLGYLEQTLGNILTQACCSVNVARPKYPGLNIRISALLHIALYLKIHNPLIRETALQMYGKVYRTYEARCRLVHDISSRMRSMDNPFVKYPTPRGPREVDTGTVSKPSSIVILSSTVSNRSISDKIVNVFI